MIIRNDFRNNTVSSNNNRGNFLREKKTIVQRLGLGGTGRGRRKKTTNSDTLLEAKSLKSLIKRAKFGIAKFKFKNLSNQNIDFIDETLDKVTKTGISSENLELSKKEIKKARAILYKKYKNSRVSKQESKHKFSKQDYEDGVEFFKELGKKSSVIPRTRDINYENKERNKDFSKDRPVSQNIIIKEFSSSLDNQFEKNREEKSVIKASRNIQQDELEEDLRIKEPSEQDDDIDHLRSQAKDLAI